MDPAEIRRGIGRPENAVVDHRLGVRLYFGSRLGSFVLGNQAVPPLGGCCTSVGWKLLFGRGDPARIVLPNNAQVKGRPI